MAGVSICGDLMSVAGCLKRRQGDSNSGVSQTAAANDVITDLASSCASSREFSRATVLQARSHEELLGDKDKVHLLESATRDRRPQRTQRVK